MAAESYSSQVGFPFKIVHPGGDAEIANRTFIAVLGIGFTRDPARLPYNENAWDHTVTRPHGRTQHLLEVGSYEVLYVEFICTSGQVIDRLS